MSKNNKYSEVSERNISESHEDLQLIFRTVLSDFDHSVVKGNRGEAEQNNAYAKGFSKLKYPQSKHNKKPSEAVDAYPYPISFKDTKRIIFFAEFVIQTANILFRQGEIKHHIRWGGDWDRDTDLNDNSFQDFGHFELVP